MSDVLLLLPGNFV